MENSIEEDIARIAKLITTKFNNDYSIDNKDKEAIEHILSDYKRVLKENEEYSKQLDLDYVDKNYIPIQKVKNEKEKLDEKYNELVDEVYNNPIKALTDFQRIIGGREILKKILKESEA